MDLLNVSVSFFPYPAVVVEYSPTPSTVIIADSTKGLQ